MPRRHSPVGGPTVARRRKQPPVESGRGGWGLGHEGRSPSVEDRTGAAHVHHCGDTGRGRRRQWCRSRARGAPGATGRTRGPRRATASCSDDGDEGQPNELPRQPMPFCLRRLQGGTRGREGVRARRQGDAQRAAARIATTRATARSLDGVSTTTATRPVARARSDPRLYVKYRQTPSGTAAAAAMDACAALRRSAIPATIRSPRHRQQAERVPVSDRLRELIAGRRVVRATDRPGASRVPSA